MQDNKRTESQQSIEQLLIKNNELVMKNNDLLAKNLEVLKDISERLRMLITVS